MLRCSAVRSSLAPSLHHHHWTASNYSSGEFLTFGLPCLSSSSLLYTSPSILASHPFIKDRDANKVVLPPASSPSSSSPASSIMIRRICSDTLILLNNGQLYDLDDYNSFEPWVRESIASLNAMNLPLINVVVGGTLTRSSSSSTSRSGTGAGSTLISALQSPLHASSGHFFLCLSSFGDVYSFGRNVHGQLGLGHARTDVFTPTRIAKFTPASRMAAQHDDMIRGRNVDGNANGYDPSHIKHMSQSSVPCEIVSIAAGHGHSIALTSRGEVYAWGRNMEGQTGLNIEENSSYNGTTSTATRSASSSNTAMHVTPRFVQHLASASVAGIQAGKIVAVAACHHTSIVLAEDGRVYQWGYGIAKRQLNVPALIAFESADDTPRIIQLAVGNQHALLLDDRGVAYSLGHSLTGALGHDLLARTNSSGGGQEYSSCLSLARAIPTDNITGNERIVRVVAGAYYSALIDANGHVFTFGAGSDGKLGLDPWISSPDSGAGGVNVAIPTFVSALNGKCANDIFLGARRMIVFVPTKISKCRPSVVQMHGGTRIIIEGEGFIEREDWNRRDDDDDVESSQIVVSFAYNGVNVRVPARYDPINDVLELSTPSLTPASTQSRGAPPASYRNGALEQCIVRVSMDGGLNFSNALSLQVFKVPTNSGSVASTAASTAASAASAASARGRPSTLQSASSLNYASLDVTPCNGPIQGGSVLMLHAPFDVMQYESILVRFRSDFVATSSSSSGILVHDRAVIGVVQGVFDPVNSCIRCLTPCLLPSHIPPSSVAAPIVASKSRFIQPQPRPIPAATLIRAIIDISLDGQNYFSLPKAEFMYYNVTAETIPVPSIAAPVAPTTATSLSMSMRSTGATIVSQSVQSPAAHVVGLAGGALRIPSSGVHYTSSLFVRFDISSGYASVVVPATFLSLASSRALARGKREKSARRGRHDRALAEAKAQALIAQTLAEAEEARDPSQKEKDKAAKDGKLKEKEAKEERERQIREQQKGGQIDVDDIHNASSAAAPLESPKSRPPSSTRTSLTNRRSSISSPKSSPLTSPNPRSPAVPPASSTDRGGGGGGGSPGMHALHADSSPSISGAGGVDALADAASTSPIAVAEPDDYALLEARFVADEAAQDKYLSILSPSDRAAIGFICCDTPVFTSYGACTPALSLTLNGRDFHPLTGSGDAALLYVRTPQPRVLRPNCGPVAGGTEVEVVGEYFYATKDVDVQMRAVVATSSVVANSGTSRPMSAGGSNAAPSATSASTSTSGLAAPMSAASKRGTPSQGTSHRKNGDDISSSSSSTSTSILASPLAPSMFVAAPAFIVPPFVSSAVPGAYSLSPLVGEPTITFVSPAWIGAGATSTHIAFDPNVNGYSASAANRAAAYTGNGNAPLVFTYYDSPLVSDAHPMLLSQLGGTDVTLTGRGLVSSDCIKVRLVLIDEGGGAGDNSASAAAAASALAAASGGMTSSSSAANSVSSTRRKITAATAHAAAQSSIAYADGRDSTSPTPITSSVTFIDVAAVYHANDVASSDSGLPSSLSSPSPASAGDADDANRRKRANVKRKVDGEVEPELASVTFVAPMATAFNTDLPDGSVPRSLTVEIAINGQQFVATGIVLRYEKDAKANSKKKIEAKKK